MTLTTAEDLERFCREIGKPVIPAQRMVRRLTKGVSIEEAVSVVQKLLGEDRQGGIPMTNQNGSAGSTTVDGALKGIDARRVAVANRLEELARERKELKAEEKQLNSAGRRR